MPTTSPSDPLEDAQPPHSPDQCEEYDAADCVKHHQSSPAFRQAYRAMADRASKDAAADLEDARAVFEKAKTVGRDEALRNIKEARAALEALVATGKQQLKQLDQNKRAAAAARGWRLPDAEDRDGL
ncbi:hypothetical protein MMC15_001097 [Xylographa vitiligo]|nr:hypothetical protein [Xylographa vitiligo]